MRPPARIPRCGHPDRPHFAFYMCAPCYNAARKAQRIENPARCHPNRRRFRGTDKCRECVALSSPGAQRRIDAILASATYGEPGRCRVPLVRIEDGIEVCRLCSNIIRPALKEAI